MTGLAFLDTETTGLDPDRHEIWEVALIVGETEHVWQLPVDLGRADSRALDVGRFHERRWAEHPTEDPDHVVGRLDLPAWCRDFARLTWGRHLVGAVVSFDEERLRRLLRANHTCPGWHYHLIDVEALAVGFVVGRDGLPVLPSGERGVPLPWNSRTVSSWVGVDPDGFDQHTALGDAQWAKAIYEACTGGTR